VGDAKTALRLAGALWRFWYVRGYAAEGRAHLAAVLALPTSDPLRSSRAQALLGAGQIATTQGDHDWARTWLRESVALYRGLGDSRGLAEALLASGFTARVQEDAEGAARALQEALTTARSIGHTFIEAASLHHLGLLAVDVRSDQPTARRLLEESLALYRRLELPRFVSLLLLALGDLARLRGDLPRADELLRESLTMLGGTGERLGIHGVLDAFAELAMTDGEAERAVRLAGAADRLRRRQGTKSWPVLARRREQWLTRARSVLGNATLEVVWEAGSAMSADDAVALALTEPRTSRAWEKSAATPSKRTPDVLAADAAASNS
jgi:non-specific serine/threonine protein kinase